MATGSSTDQDSFLVIGHRGLPELAPENSGSGFKLAVDLGIPMVELDIRLTKDKEVVVIHDNDIRRISDGKGKVTQKEFRYLRQFDYGSWFHPRFKGEKLLTLKETLDILLPKVGVMIEIKEDKKTRHEMAEELVKILDKYRGMLSKIIVCSFSDKLLLDVQKYNLPVKLGLIVRTKPKKNFHNAFEFGFDSVHPYHRIANKSLIKWAKTAGLEIFIWTVDSIKSIRKWKSLGVLGVITNIPERILNQL